jgi:hypothetical protein
LARSRALLIIQALINLGQIVSLLRGRWRVTLPRVLVLAALLLCSACPGPREAEGGGQKTPGGTPRLGGKVTEAASIAYTGNFVGFQRPCGCTTKQDGGLVRLGTALAYLRAGTDAQQQADLPPLLDGAVFERPANLPPAAPVWLLECGNFADPRSRDPGVRARVHLRALAQLDCSAAVIGGEELALDERSALQALGDSPLPLLSCNAQATDPAIQIVPAVQFAPGWHAVGVSVPKAGLDPPSRWASLSDPLAGARNAVAALPAGSRVLIAGAALPPALSAQLRALAVEGRQVIAVIGHGDDTGTGEAQPAAAGSLAPLLPVPEPRGRKLRLASFYPQAPGGRLSWDLTLDDKWPDDDAVMRLLRGGEEELRKAALGDPFGWRKVDWGRAEGLTQQELEPLLSEKAPAALSETYSGSDSCKACHSAAHQAWEASRHRHSYRVLIEHGEAQTLDCLECHTTGLLRPGGYNPEQSFDVLKDPLAAVGCESCHGPAAEHVKLAGEGKLKGWQRGDAQSYRAAGLQATALTDCLRCHDDYNSPEFEAQSYWEKVKH